MALPLIMAGLAIGKGAIDAYGQEQQRKATRAGYRKMAEVTPSERAYQQHLRDMAEGGDPFQNELMREQMQRVVGNIRQTGAENLQRTEGSIIGQGMESSIVAAELRRKTQRDTLKSVAEQSRRISAENRAQQERTKRAAGERLHQFSMGLEGREREMEGKVAALGGYDRWGTLANIAMSGAETYMGAGGEIPFTGGKSMQDIEFDRELDQYKRKLETQYDVMGGPVEDWSPYVK